MTDEDMGVLIAVATVIRVNLEDQNHLPKGFFENSKLPPPQVLSKNILDLAKLARHFERLGQTTDAIAAIAVLNTVRCLNGAELRGLGCQMWTELARGMPFVERALSDGEAKKGEPFPKRVWSEWKKLPAGLEPPKSQSKSQSKRKAATWPKTTNS